MPVMVRPCHPECQTIIQLQFLSYDIYHMSYKINNIAMSQVLGYGSVFTYLTCLTTLMKRLVDVITACGCA